MTAGRKPKPTNMKILQGNPGKRPLNRAEPKPTAKIPSCPKTLTGEARKEWRRVTKELAQLGLLTAIDRAVLALYCQAWGRWVYAEEQLEKLRTWAGRDGEEPELPPPGWTFTTDKGYEGVTPWLSIANKAASEVRKLAAEFGMTPSSRSRVTVTKAEEVDPYEAFRRQRTGTTG
jgi:P27 family predicted phage terminase small subunit